MGRFIQAANFTPARRTKNSIWYLVVHDEEYPFKDHAALDIAEFFHKQAKSSHSGSSAHRVVDNKEIIHCVRWDDIAWAAPGANTKGMHWEQSGYARMKNRDWRDQYGIDQIELLAQDMADFAHFCGWSRDDLHRLTVAQIQENVKQQRAVHRGIVGHIDITNAFPTVGTHQDPGPNFPWNHLLNRVRHYFDARQK